MNQPIEVLAPAGSPESLTAAVRCGATAVYLGVGSFNARRAAHNFTLDDLTRAVAYCHGRGVAVHLALNTLLREDELDNAIQLACDAADRGVDALILQDVGLARRLQAIMPAMPLHASTQLSCHTPAGVSFLRDSGFSRVVLAREMSREEIAACTNLGVETEVFVHGALCMSVSGQCYFSAMLGGRSGNRGACAQTCRLPFAPASHTARATADRAVLSLKDSCLVDYVQDLKGMGVASLKIEGRMKRPEYVAAAAALYAAAARGEAISPAEVERLKKVFSRTGFTDGYYTAHRGKAMFGVRRKEDVTAATPVLGTLQHTYDKEYPLVAIHMTFTADTDKCTLLVSDGTHSITVNGEGAQPAINRPLDPERAKEQLGKTGGTPFYASHITCAIGQGLTLPMAQLNALRRGALDTLLTARERITPVPYQRTAKPLSTESLAYTLPHRLVRLATARQYSAALKEALVFLPLDTAPDAIRALVADGQAVGIDIPRGLFGQEAACRQALHQAASAGATAALCGNVGAIPLAIEAGLTPIGGFGLNITNREAIRFYQEKGLRAATLSMELTFPQMNTLQGSSLPLGLLVYGRQPLMLTRNCPRQCAGGSCQSCHSEGLVDRTGTRFPVMCTGGCAEVLNSVPLYWGDRLRELPPMDFHLYHFTDETPQDVAQILRDYGRQGKPPAAITRGLYRRGVE